MNVGIATAALAGGDFCGDACGAWENPDRTTLCVVDGLGHGQHAEAAARLSIDCVARNMDATLDEIFARCDARLLDTRGAMLGVATIDHRAGSLSFVRIGNIRALVVGPRIRRLPSNHGIVGAGFKTLGVQSISMSSEDKLIMFTDGVNELPDLSRYRLPRNAQGLAEDILRDWSLGTDDAAVLVWTPNPV